MSRTSTTTPSAPAATLRRLRRSLPLVAAAGALAVTGALVAPQASATPTTARITTAATAATTSTASAAATAVTPATARAVSATHPPQLSWHLRGTGFGSSVLVTQSADGTGRLFVVDQKGRILVWTAKHPTPVNYLDMRTTVNSSGGEQGMLGLAFYPDFVHHPIFWVSYTRADGALVVARFVLPTYTTGTVSPSLGQTVIVVPHPTNQNHNAGMLVFGRDRLLYISTGDGGGQGDPNNNAGNGKSLSGKILRIDVARGCAAAGHPLYCIPPTNAWATSTVWRKEIYAMGLRNPWRFSMDPATGDLWIGDVGESRFEEIDIAPYHKSPINFGWSCREGNSYFVKSRCNPNIHYTTPAAIITHPSASALIGGVVYHGRLYQAVMGPRYIFGDYVTGHVWTMPRGGKPTLAGSLSGITSLGSDGVGEVWATTLSGGLYVMTAR